MPLKKVCLNQWLAAANDQTTKKLFFRCEDHFYMLILLLVSWSQAKPFAPNIYLISAHGRLTPLTIKEDIADLQHAMVEPQRTEALINNTLVASEMFYRFLRVIYRAGTIIYSYMPPLPAPF